MFKSQCSIQPNIDYNLCCIGINDRPWVCAHTCVWILQNLTIGHVLKFTHRLFVTF